MSRWLRVVAALGVLALLVTCAQQLTDGSRAGGVEPSPAGRVNPFEPGFTNGSGGPR